MARRAEWLVRGALVASSLAAAALVAELALRAAGYAPARLEAPGELYSRRERVFLDCYPSNPRGYFDLDLRRPDVRDRLAALGVAGIDAVAARAPFAVEFRYNSLFLRDREPGPRRAGVRRVVLLGDSFTEGQGVKERDTTARILEGILGAGGDGRWEVVNAGRRGADFPALHKMFDRALAFEPDVVVHATVLNDADRSPELDARRGLDDWILERRRLVEGAGPPARSAFAPRLVELARDRVESWRVSRATTRWYLDLYGPANAEGWARTTEAWRDMDRRMRARGGRLLLASWPLLVDLDRYPFTAADAAVARFCREAAIPRVDLRDALQTRSASDLWVHPVDHHPNEVAHALAAQALAGPVKAAAAGAAQAAGVP